MAEDGDAARNYRAYLINLKGHVVRPLTIDATNDDDAVAQARQYVDGHSVELWELARKVVFLPSDKQAASDERSEQ